MKFETVVFPLREGGKKDQDTAVDTKYAIGTDGAVNEGREQECLVLKPVLGFEILVSLLCWLEIGLFSFLTSIHTRRHGKMMTCRCCPIKKQQCCCNMHAMVEVHFINIY